jgi:hypothetical protein
MKAGLNAQCWLEDDTRIYKFQGQIFKEWISKLIWFIVFKFTNLLISIDLLIYVRFINFDRFINFFKIIFKNR